MGKIDLTPTSNIPSRPIALVTTCDVRGKPNIITVGSVYFLTRNPPLVGIGIIPHRYSHWLLEQVPEFVINFPTKELIWAVDYCGTGESGEHIDKFNNARLTPVKASKVRPPIIKECKIHFECVVVEKLILGDEKQHVNFIGEVIAVSADEDILNNQKKVEWQKGDLINYNAWTGQYFSMLGDFLEKDGFTKKKVKREK